MGTDLGEQTIGRAADGRRSPGARSPPSAERVRPHRAGRRARRSAHAPRRRDAPRRSTTTRSACRNERRVHPVRPGSVSSTTWSLPTSASCINSDNRGTPTLSAVACEMSGRLRIRSTRSLERCRTEPNLPISVTMASRSGVGVERRGDGHGQRGGATRPPGLGPQARDHAAGDVQHERRRPDHQLLEHVGGQRGERGVANGANRRRPRCVIEQPEFADDVATAELGDAPTVTAFELGPITLRRGRIAAIRLHRDHEAATDDEVGGVGLLALLEQHLAGLEPPPLDTFRRCPGRAPGPAPPAGR